MKRQAVSRRIFTFNVHVRFKEEKWYCERFITEYFELSFRHFFYSFSFIIDITQAYKVVTSLNETPFSFSLYFEYNGNFVNIIIYYKNYIKSPKIQVHSLTNMHNLTMLQQVAHIVDAVL
jgi:hypothetical protein